MILPEHAPIDAAAIAAIAERHGLGAVSYERLAHPDIINAIYRLGERFVLRVPRSHPARRGTMDGVAAAGYAVNFARPS